MKLYTQYINLLFFVLAVTIALFIGNGGKNYLLLSVVALSPFFIFMRRIKMDKAAFAFVIFLVCLALSSLFNLNRFRASSFFYTFFLVTSFLVLRDAILKDFFKIEVLTKRIRMLIYAYFVVLVLQQLCVLLHVPVINQMASFENPWKLSSLALEPSHLPRFLFFLMYAYLSLRTLLLGRAYQTKDFKKDGLVWVSYFWCMLSCVSTTALLFVFLIFLQGRRAGVKKIIMFSCSGVLLAISVSFLVDSALLERTIEFLKALSTMSVSQINAVDHSAAYRFAPVFAFVDNVNPTNIHFWIGYGLDYGREYCQKYMYNLSGDVAYMGGVNIGGMSAFVIDYGLIFIVTLGKAVFETIKDCKDKIILVVWIVSSLLESINMQMFWFSLILLVCVGYYTKKYNSAAIKNGDSNRVYNEVIDK